MTMKGKKKLTFLGTGTSQGVPVICCECDVCHSSSFKDHRLRSSVKIESENCNVVIDVGPDFRQQMLVSRTNRLDAILLTHEHNDHIIGMDDIRPFNFKQKGKMNVYGMNRVLQEVKNRFQYVFVENVYPGSPQINLTEINHGQEFSIGDLNFMALEVMHGNLPILGYKIDNLAYFTDVKTIPESTIESIKVLDILIISALHHWPHHSHSNLIESIEWAKKIDAKQTFFIHMSHHMGLHDEVSKQLPENISLAYDGLEIFF